MMAVEEAVHTVFHRQQVLLKMCSARPLPTAVAVIQMQIALHGVKILHVAPTLLVVRMMAIPATFARRPKVINARAIDCPVLQLMLARLFHLM